MPIRVMYILTELAPGGAERCVANLATGLDRRRFEASVVGLRGGPMADELRAAGVRCESLDLYCRCDASALARLVRRMRRFRPDIVHTHLFHADLAGRFAAAWVGSAKLIHTVHVAEQRPRRAQFLWARWARGACDRIVCVSEAVRDHHRRRSGLPAGDYRVIRNGIDVDRYGRDDDARRRLRRQWGVKPGERVGCFVGRLDRQKGVDVLAEALVRLGSDAPIGRWMIAGEGPERAWLSDRVDRAGLADRVRLLGRVDNVPELLSACDIFALPSRWEGLPLAAMEAMAAGLAVVVSDGPGLTEVVQDGRTGLVVPVGDVASLARALRSLAEDAALRSRLATEATRDARRRFGLSRYLASHEALYVDTLGRPGKL
jgi:glycosyltransferase involved in cell wall biosynthesis